MARKDGHVNKKQKRSNRTKREKGDFQGTTEDVLLADIRDLLVPHAAGEVGQADDQSHFSLPERFSEVKVKIEMISSTGDGLGFANSRNHVYVVPFTVPGDFVQAKVVTHFAEDHYTLTDFIKVITPGRLRDDKRVKCPYFSQCSGCQFQMLSYPDQLVHKKTIVERAYRHFSNLTPESVPAVHDTMASPLQYSYRTKLTPHFDGPRNARKDKRAGHRPAFPEVPPIGFMIKNTRRTLDIEDCPIGTPVVREGIKTERERVKREIGTYQRGATLLLRESTERVRNEDCDGAPLPDSKPSSEADILPPGDYMGSGPAPAYREVKTCITDNNATTTEYVGDYVFTNPAGAFFQNNNLILPEFTQYVQSLITSPSQDPDAPPITHLIDAYCGSGLFTISTSSLGLISTGIDISSSSIACAETNAKLNKLPASHTNFMAADAAAIFADVKSPAQQTIVVIDPPRKGCDKSFLSQLLAYGPRRLVYVSCNVHTQARDVAVLVEGARMGEGEEQRTTRYELKSLRGLDFFPQTGHVESVALLEKS